MTIGTKTKTTKKNRTQKTAKSNSSTSSGVKRKAGTVKAKTVKKVKATRTVTKTKTSAAAKSAGADETNTTVRQSRGKAVTAATKKKAKKKKTVKTASAKATRTKVTGGKVGPAKAKSTSAAPKAPAKAKKAPAKRKSRLQLKEQDILERLSVSMDRYDDIPNLELAASIVFHLDREAVEILIAVMERNDEVHGPDAARVLAEVASRDAELIEPYVERMVALVNYDNWEMLPFVMCSLAPMGDRVAEDLWDYRELLWAVLNEESDDTDFAQAAAVKLLSAMCAAGPDYARTLAGGLVDLLGKCMPCHVAMYAEAVLPALGSAHSHRAKPVLDRRIKELMPAEVARLRRAARGGQPSSGYFAAA